MFPIETVNINMFAPQLLEIPQPPKILYSRGEIMDLSDKKILVVVGSRKHTSYGKNVTESLIASLRGLPVVVVSGLAYGIDSIAHEAALSAGIPTIAFPGSGLNDSVIYPSQHRGLAKKILESGGMLLSEFKPDQKAALWTFPTRNRLVAGLCHAVMIPEAEKKSGTLITSRLATEYNRDVLAVPGQITSPTSVGTHMLIRLGATPITCADDLKEALGFTRSDDPNIEKRKEIVLDLSPLEKKLYDLLREPISRDELIRELDISTSDFNMTLTMLEIKGVIKEEMGMIRLA